MKLQFSDLGSMNVPKYCRKIMKMDDYPKTLEIYRGDMLCLTVNVDKASRLLLVENDRVGPVYKKYVPMSEEKKQRLRLKGATLRSASTQGEV